MNQHERIIQYMNRYGSITPFEAFEDLGVTKLATRISEMIRDGVIIEKCPERRKNRYGEVTHYMRYKLGGEN